MHCLVLGPSGHGFHSHVVTKFGQTDGETLSMSEEKVAFFTGAAEHEFNFRLVGGSKILPRAVGHGSNFRVHVFVFCLFC